eukprot:220882-Chlamydomonas_euryale.AAC.1
MASPPEPLLLMPVTSYTMATDMSESMPHICGAGGHGGQGVHARAGWVVSEVPRHESGSGRGVHARAGLVDSDEFPRTFHCVVPPYPTSASEMAF